MLIRFLRPINSFLVAAFSFFLVHVNQIKPTYECLQPLLSSISSRVLQRFLIHLHRSP